MTTTQRAIALLLFAVAIAFGAPNFAIDGIALDPNDPGIGRPIDRIVDSTWFVSFEDLPMGISDKDYNDYALIVHIFDDGIRTSYFGGLSAHQHEHRVLSPGNPHLVHIQMTDLTTHHKVDTGTPGAWVQCLLGCSTDPTPTEYTPEPSSLALMGGGLGAAMWWGKKRRCVS